MKKLVVRQVSTDMQGKEVVVDHTEMGQWTLSPEEPVLPKDSKKVGQITSFASAYINFVMAGRNQITFSLVDESLKVPELTLLLTVKPAESRSITACFCFSDKEEEAKQMTFMVGEMIVVDVHVLDEFGNRVSATDLSSTAVTVESVEPLSNITSKPDITADKITLSFCINTQLSALMHNKQVTESS